MRYRKLTITWKEAPKRLNRTLLVREDIDLFTLGATIMTSFRAGFAHYFMLRSKGQSYIPENFGELWNDHTFYMSDFHLLDLGEKFSLIYDTGENYEFNITVAKTAENIRSRRLAFLLKGAGLGIFEDNIMLLFAYINGDITAFPKGIEVPWNLILLMKKLKDFDTPLALDIDNEQLQNDIEYTLMQLDEQDYY